MGTIIGILAGVAATIVVARYYFRRTINKQISVFVLLSNRVFAGIDQDVRKKLAFHYANKEIAELQQIDLIITNDGDRAIRDCIEPLQIVLKGDTIILDASVLHRQPNDLQVIIEQQKNDDSAVVVCKFPLLNSGEFFMLKLLLDGYVSRSEIECRILVDDLPRSFATKSLPPNATTEPKRKIEWVGVALGSIFLLGVAAQATFVWSYYELKPSISPFPWNQFSPTWIETSALIILSLGAFFMMILGLILLIGMGFEEFFKLHPRFPLPEELRSRKYRFPPGLMIDDFDPDDRIISLKNKKKSEQDPEQATPRNPSD